MQKKEIEMYLAQLGQELQDPGVQRPVRILVIGGAFMLLQVKNRRTTDDIDILLKDGEDATTSALSQTFKVAVRDVAARNMNVASTALGRRAFRKILKSTRAPEHGSCSIFGYE